MRPVIISGEIYFPMEVHIRQLKAGQLFIKKPGAALEVVIGPTTDGTMMKSQNVRGKQTSRYSMDSPVILMTRI